VVLTFLSFLSAAGAVEGLEVLRTSNPLVRACSTYPVFVVWGRAEVGGQQDVRGVGASRLRVGIGPISMGCFVSFSHANSQMVMMFSCDRSCAEQTPVHWEIAEFSVLQCPSPTVLPLLGGTDAEGEASCAT